MNSQTQREIIYSLGKLLNKYYVFPDIAKEIGKLLQLNFAGKHYENINDLGTLCERITKELQQISKDKHLRLRYTELERSMDQKINRNEIGEEFLLRGEIDNYGFHKIERLPGNIGYIDIREFFDPEFAIDVAVNAMNFVAHTDVLIFDLRNNKGGSLDMVTFLVSYLSESEPFHLNRFYQRSNHLLKQFDTSLDISEKQYEDKPVYVLTSEETLYAGEEFAFTLKNLKRVTVIGEVAGAGASPGDYYQLAKHIKVFIPNEYPINPITKVNGEVVGMGSSMETVQDQAFEMAYECALYYVINHYRDRKQYEFLVREAERSIEKRFLI